MSDTRTKREDPPSARGEPEEDELYMLNATLGTDISDVESISQLNVLHEIYADLLGDRDRQDTLHPYPGNGSVSGNGSPRRQGRPERAALTPVVSMAGGSQPQGNPAGTMSAPLRPAQPVKQEPEYHTTPGSTATGAGSTSSGRHPRALSSTITSASLNSPAALQASARSRSQLSPLSRVFEDDGAGATSSSSVGMAYLQAQSQIMTLERKVAQLQAQLQSQTRDAKETRNRDAARIAELESQVYDLQAANHAQQQRYDQEVLRHQTEVANMKLQHTAEIDKLREELRAALSLRSDRGLPPSSDELSEGYASRVVATLKAELQDLRISEPVYLEFKARAPEARTLREAVCIKVYEMLRAQELEQERLKDELKAAEERARKHEQQSIDAVRERDSERRTRERQVAQLQHVAKELEAQLSVYEEQIAQLRNQVREQREKALQFDSVRAHADALERRLIDAEASIKAERGQQHNNSEELSRLRSQMQLDAKEMATLRSDKIFLQRELESSRGELKRALDECQLLRRRVDELEHAKRDLTDELLKVQTESRLNYESKLDKELARIGAMSEAEVAKLRAHQRDMYEREIAQLNESLSTVRREADNLRSQLEALRRCADADAEAARAARGQLESQLADVRGELKLKAFEAERATAEAAQAQKDVERLKVALDTERAKGEIIREEFFTLREEAGLREAQWRQEEKLLRDQIASYEALEHDLDLAILKAGKDVATAFDNPESATLSQTIRGVDAVLNAITSQGASSIDDAKRRVKQSLMLAHRLTEKQRELETVRKDLAQAQALCTKLQLENSNLQRAVIRGAANTLQASKSLGVENMSTSLEESANATAKGDGLNVLANTLRAQNEEIRELRAQLTGMEAVNSTLRTRISVLENQIEAERAKAKTVCSKLAKDLRRLLHQQKQVAVARELIKRLVAMQSQPAAQIHTGSATANQSQQMQLLKQLQQLLPAQGGTDVPVASQSEAPRVNSSQPSQQPRVEQVPQTQLQSPAAPESPPSSPQDMNKQSASSSSMKELADLLRSCLTARFQSNAAPQASSQVSGSNVHASTTTATAAKSASTSTTSPREQSRKVCDSPTASVASDYGDEGNASRDEINKNASVTSAPAQALSQTQVSTDSSGTSDQSLPHLPRPTVGAGESPDKTSTASQPAAQVPQLQQQQQQQQLPASPHPAQQTAATVCTPAASGEQQQPSARELNIIVTTPRDTEIYANPDEPPVMRISFTTEPLRDSQKLLSSRQPDGVLQPGESIPVRQNTYTTYVQSQPDPFAAVSHLPFEYLQSIAQPFEANVVTTTAAPQARFPGHATPAGYGHAPGTSPSAHVYTAQPVASARSVADSYASDQFSTYSYTGGR